MLALHLREQWKKSGRDGLVFLAEDENRAERLGGIVHALDPSLDVLVFPRLNTLPFDGLEPSREIAGRRSSVLRRLARRKKPILLVSTAEDHGAAAFAGELVAHQPKPEGASVVC